MALPVTDLGLDDVNVELQRPATQYVELNDTGVRNLAAKTAGQIGLSDLLGKQFRKTVNIVLSAHQQNVYFTPANLAAWGYDYIAGVTDITITVNSGVYIGSSSTGAYAMQITGFTAGDTVHLINNSWIIGRGGNGGSAPSGGGGQGGYSLYVNFPTSITNNGVIAGGGGGGGASANTSKLRTVGPNTNYTTYYAGNGGGGGAGYTAGSGGAGTTYNNDVGAAGSGGSISGGGTGGQNVAGWDSGGGTTTGGVVGGNGGAYGLAGGAASPGGAGGAPGYYIVGNANVTWLVAGTRRGYAA